MGWFTRKAPAADLSRQFPPDLAAEIILARVTFRPDRSLVDPGAFMVIVEFPTLGRFLFTDDDSAAAVFRRAHPDAGDAVIVRAVRLLSARVADCSALQDIAGHRLGRDRGKDRGGWMQPVRESGPFFGG